MNTNHTTAQPSARLHSPVRLRLSTSTFGSTGTLTPIASPPRSPALPPSPGFLQAPVDTCAYAKPLGVPSQSVVSSGWSSIGLPSPRKTPSPVLSARPPSPLSPPRTAASPSPPLYTQGPIFSVPAAETPPCSRWSLSSGETDSLAHSAASKPAHSPPAAGADENGASRPSQFGPQVLSPAEAYKLEVQRSYAASFVGDKPAHLAAQMQLGRAAGDPFAGRTQPDAETTQVQAQANDQRPQRRTGRPTPIYIA